MRHRTIPNEHDDKSQERGWEGGSSRFILELSGNGCSKHETRKIYESNVQ